MRKGQAATESNNIPIRPVEIAANIADPVERLQQIRRNTAELEHSAKGARHLTELSTECPGALCAWSTKALMNARIGWGTRRPFYNLGISNVPGPRVPLYMDGARAVRIFFVGPCGDGCGIIWGANSYEDELMMPRHRSRPRPAAVRRRDRGGGPGHRRRTRRHHRRLRGRAARSFMAN